MPDTALQRKPTTAEWSALEIADHLARTETGIVAAVIEFLPSVFLCLHLIGFVGG